MRLRRSSIRDLYYTCVSFNESFLVGRGTNKSTNINMLVAIIVITIAVTIIVVKKELERASIKKTKIGTKQ